MPALIPLYNTASPRGVWMNSAPSSVITNTAAEVAFDQFWTMQSQSEVTISPNSVITFYARGLYSSAVILPTLTIRLRLNSITGTILGQTASSPVIAAATNAAWSFTGSIFMRTPGPSGTLEFQGASGFQGSTLISNINYLPNTGPQTVDTTVDNPFLLTAQWGGASSSNSIQLRNIVVTQENP